MLNEPMTVITDQDEDELFLRWLFGPSEVVEDEGEGEEVETLQAVGPSEVYAARGLYE